MIYLAGRITIDQPFISATIVQETPECPIFRIPQLWQCMKFRHFNKNSPKRAKSSRTTLTQVCGRVISIRSLQYPVIAVISLHGELRTLREGICKSCKQKFVPANLVSESSQAAKPKPAPTVSSLVKSSQGLAKHTIPTFSWRRLLKTHVSSHIPTNSGPPKSEILKESKNTSLSVPIPSIPDEAVTQKPLPSAPRWFAERDPTANVALDVTFVREFIQNGPVQFVRFSPDGKHLAAVVTTAHYKNGVIFIYNVVTGDKTWWVLT